MPKVKTCTACPESPVLSRKQKRNAKGGKSRGFELICPVCGAKYPI